MWDLFLVSAHPPTPSNPPPPTQKLNGPSLSSVLATTGDKSAVAGYTPV